MKQTFSCVEYAWELNFDPLLIFDAIIGTKVEQNSFWRQFESGPNFILNTWSENSQIICNASQVDQSSFGMHILHVIRSLSRTLLDQNSYTSGTICYRWILKIFKPKYTNCLWYSWLFSEIALGDDPRNSWIRIFPNKMWKS